MAAYDMFMTWTCVKELEDVIKELKRNKRRVYRDWSLSSERKLGGVLLLPAGALTLRPFL